MSKFLTIPVNNRKNKRIPVLKIPNKHSQKNFNGDKLIDINNNNKFYKETISSNNKKYSTRNNSPVIVIKKKTEEEYNEIEIKKYQQNFLNSLLSEKNKSKKKLVAFDQYNSVLTKSLNHYKSKGITEEELKETETETDREKNNNKINNILNSNNISEEKINKNNNKSISVSKSKLKININDINYKNPFQSLNIINDNNLVFNEISKDVLVRQRNLYDKCVEQLQGNLSKFNIKMPKVKVSKLNPKMGDEISMINLVNNENDKNMFPVIPHTSRDLKLFAYFRYAHKNFPEGRQQFSLCTKESNIIMSGGLSSNMKTMQLWSLNIDQLQWNKIQTLNTTNCRYGHTSNYYQNCIYYFGGKIKEDNRNVLAGLEIYNFEENSFSVPQNIIDTKLRTNHISCLIAGQILFHGGINTDNEILNDILLLNLNPLKWINPIINNYLPMPRVYGHASCLVIPTSILIHYKFNIYRYPDEEKNADNKKDNNKLKERGLYIFGGKTKEEGGLTNDLWVLVLGQKPIYWEKLKTNGNPPCPRYFHSMNYFEKSNFLIVHGGRNDNISSVSALDDTYILDLSNLGWVKIELYSNVPNFKVFSRYGHNSSIFLDKLIILGGVNNNNYLGSALFIVNLDFYYNTKMKSIEQLMVERLLNNKDNKDDSDYKLKINKLKKYRKSLKEIGIVSPIVLPPIK